MKKKAGIAAILAIALCVIPFLKGSPGQSVEAQGEIKVYVSGKLLGLATPPYIEKSIAMVPVLGIAEALGAKAVVSETGEAHALELSREGRKAILTVGSKTLITDERNVMLPAAPIMTDGKFIAPVRAITEALGAVTTWDSVKRAILINEPNQLPAIGTVGHLLDLLKDAQKRSVNHNFTGRADMPFTLAMEAMGAAETTSSDGAIADSSGSAKGEFSTTNIQVEGVDEGDWAKTDGSYIYQISGRSLFITDISDPTSPRLASNLEFGDDKSFWPRELFIDEGSLIVVGEYNGQDFIRPLEDGTSMDDTSEIAQPLVGKYALMPDQTLNAVKAYIYELDGKGTPKLVRELSQEGSYLATRKIDQNLYIITNKHNYIYPYYEGLTSRKEDRAASKTAERDLKQVLEPHYGDSAIADSPQVLPLEDIRYFPEPDDASMMLVGAIDVLEADSEFQVQAYMGAGETVYASRQHLYVAVTKFSERKGGFKQETVFHKFKLDHGNAVYLHEGKVPGLLLNQFSMDEHDGYFRAALTNGDMWATGSDSSTNNLYVLDETMQVTGKLEGLAPGERIYSVRFMEDRAYMVTFRNVDPLFAIDLRNPFAPALLGQLKIPGYSDYLHPYDENHLIGFGKDTVEVPSKAVNGDDTIALYQGLKMALFDVTDVSQPKEKFKEIIGDRGTHSELLNNHKALLFSKSKGLLAFPVELHVADAKDQAATEDAFMYGQFANQAAYVYHIDINSGFTLRGTIIHLTNEDLLKSGQFGFDTSKAVRRILYAGDTLYTLSESLLKSNSLDSLNELGTLKYPKTAYAEQ